MEKIPSAWAWKYKFDKLTGVCISIAKTPSQYHGASFLKYCERELSKVPGGLDGLTKTETGYRSTPLDAAPVAHVGKELADAFGMRGLPNLIIHETVEPTPSPKPAPVIVSSLVGFNPDAFTLTPVMQTGA